MKVILPTESMDWWHGPGCVDGVRSLSVFANQAACELHIGDLGRLVIQDHDDLWTMIQALEAARARMIMNIHARKCEPDDRRSPFGDKGA